MAITLVARRHASAAIIAAVAAQAGGTELSKQGYLDLLQHEGMVLEPYYDVAGVKTVCIGETKAVENRLHTTRECGEKAVRRVETEFVPPVKKCTKVWNQLGQATKDALIQFAYNLGPGTYCRSSIVKRLNSGRGIEACERILPYNRAGGKIWPGLVKRRSEEAAKCRSGFA